MASGKHSKIIQVSVVLACFTAGFTMKMIFEFLAVLFGPVSKIYDIEAVRHGLPISCGLILFCVLQFHPGIQKWLEEVVVEVSKVVWPTKKDTLSMTAVVCVILILSGVVLGLFDLSAGAVMKLIMN